jgi:hypothetical protein|tara:strand:- start:3818 stop:4090 length:273 start_codon:yes stop_codon:yes gene_type:complete
MLIKLIEIHNTSGGSKSVRELYINSSNIVSVTEETHSAILEEAKLLGFSDVAHFSSVIIQEGNRTKTITVAHSPQEIYKKIDPSKTLLKG